MSSNQFNVTAIPAFSDNYIWAITGDNSDKVAIVDPGDADVCLQFLKDNFLQLSDILITHHHPDHIGGIKKLIAHAKSQGTDVNVYTPIKNDIPHSTKSVQEGDSINLSFIDSDFDVIDLPGHTLGHIAFFTNGTLFCGDTLFSGGCGRLFEGTPKQMLASLEKLSALPEQTKVYCAHEYTQANLDFALTVEPSNFDLINYYNQVKDKRARNIATIPTTILQEKTINPFLRTNQAEIFETALASEPNCTKNQDDIFAVIRRMKDNF